MTALAVDTKSIITAPAESFIVSCIIGLVIVGVVIVLFVSVSVVALPTSVSVEVGNVMVPVFEIVDITGAVSVLLVKVSVVSFSTIVPVAFGRLTVLSAVGSVATTIVSKLSAVVPSKTIPASDAVSYTHLTLPTKA